MSCLAFKKSFFYLILIAVLFINTRAFAKTAKEYYDNGKIKSKYSYLVKDGIKIKQGKATDWNSYGQKSMGSYQNNQKQGLWYFYSDNKTKYYSEGLYKNGRRNGIWLGRDHNGNISAKGNYLDDLENGHWEYYWPNGNIREKGSYFYGLKINEWASYSENGKFERNYDYWCPDPMHRTKKEKVDVTGDGKSEVILKEYVTCAYASVLIRLTILNGPITIGEFFYPPGFSSYDIENIKQLDKNGPKSMIMAVHNGASIGAFMSIIRWNGKEFVENGSFGFHFPIEYKDMNGDGDVEMILKGRYKEENVVYFDHEDNKFKSRETKPPQFGKHY